VFEQHKKLSYTGNNSYSFLIKNFILKKLFLQNNKLKNKITQGLSDPAPAKVSFVKKVVARTRQIFYFIYTLLLEIKLAQEACK